MSWVAVAAFRLRTLRPTRASQLEGSSCSTRSKAARALSNLPSWKKQMPKPKRTSAGASGWSFRALLYLRPPASLSCLQSTRHLPPLSPSSIPTFIFPSIKRAPSFSMNCPFPQYKLLSNSSLQGNSTTPLGRWDMRGDVLHPRRFKVQSCQKPACTGI